MKPLTILLVDDDKGDIEILQDYFSDAPFEHTIEIALDGQSALDRLTGDNLPDLVLLDLNMPGMNGLEVLRSIRSDESLAQLKVMILTTSDSDEDIESTFNTGANYFVTKPHDKAGFFQLMTLVVELAQTYD